MTVPVRKHLVTVLDAAAETQHWVDQFIESARTGADGWPHPHTEITLTVLPLSKFNQAMEAAGWQLTPEGTIERGSQPGAPISPIPDPDQGSTYHNVLHSLLGDFHRGSPSS